MILGIGADICHVERIRRSIRRLGDAWIDHLFSDEEKRLCRLAADPDMVFALGFCGKEACSKALGTGLADGVGWHDIEILPVGTGTTLRLTGAASERLLVMTPDDHETALSITYSGNRVLAHAFVLIFAARPTREIAG